jgi:dTDP-glucose 4,6-dehydratase
MKILLTGGAGFIGSNFILNFIDKNQILNLDKLTYAGNIENLNSLKEHPNYLFNKCDITDSLLLNDIIDKYQPDSIINFAAESHVDRSIDGPKEFINTNILGTYELLNASFKYYQKLDFQKKDFFKFLHISTDEVYGSLGKDGKFTESTSYKPSSPYSASKAASDHLVKAWYHTYGLPTLITNCSNNYGPYQFPEKLIPLVIVKCLSNEDIPIYGDGQNVRDWIYVDDHCKGIYEVLQNGKIGETYNIGGNQEISNLELVYQICDILDKIRPSKTMDSYRNLITFVKDRPGHDFRYAIDSTKIQNQLKFFPKETIHSGLRKTINWYLENEDWIENIKQNKYNQERLGINIK